jgi:hypothetical protein
VANGETTVNRFDHLLDKGVVAAVTDPEIFAQVRVGERGRSLEWPGEIDFCADALWFETHSADAPYQPQRAVDQVERCPAPFASRTQKQPLAPSGIFRQECFPVLKWLYGAAEDGDDRRRNADRGL